MQKELVAQLTDGLAATEVEQVMGYIDIYDEAVAASGPVIYETVIQPIASGDVVYSNTVGSSAWATY
jgi:hypothetical protein